MKKTFLFLSLFTLGISCIFASSVAVPNATPEAMRYYRSGNVLYAINQLWGLIIPLLFLCTGYSRKLNTVAKKIGRKWFFQFVVYFILFYLSLLIISFPLSVYEGYIRLHQYNLSTQGFAAWFTSFAKGAMVSTIFGIAFLWILYLLLQKSPRRWWFYSWLISIPCVLFIMFITPIWISPLFHNFHPMKDKELEAKIMNLADRAKIPDSKLYVVDMKKETKTVNAYVTGFGSSKRIVLWDTIIDELTEDELLFVVGHEIGHYVLHHIWYMISLIIGLLFFFLLLTYVIGNKVVHKWRECFKFHTLSNFASLPLFMLFLNLYSLITDPLTNYISRMDEHAADRFGLELTQNNEAAAKAFVKLQQTNLGNPWPGKWYVIFRSSHPPLGKRVEFCNSYHPWLQKKPLYYQDYIKKMPTPKPSPSN